MTTNLKKFAILVPAELHEHAVSRIESTFELICITRSDVELVGGEIASRVRGIASATTIDAKFMDALPHLEIVANFGVGYDMVDARHAGERGIVVTNTPDVLTEEVADTTIGLLINTTRELSRAEAWLRAGRWVSEGHYPLSAGSLRGRRAGVFGMGRIGRAVSRRLEAFGLSVAYCNRRKAEDLPYDYYDNLEEMAEAVDTLISLAPASPSTRKAINANVLSALGPQGVLVNAGRGSTLDEDALCGALEDGTILAAGLDVYENEPGISSRLANAPRLTLLPHVGSASQITRRAMADLVVDNLVSWFDHKQALTPVAEADGTSGNGSGSTSSAALQTR